MNAMLEARMVAARIQRSCPFAQGAADLRDSINASSQGSLITLGMNLIRHSNTNERIDKPRINAGSHESEKNLQSFYRFALIRPAFIRVNPRLILLSSRLA